MPTRAEMEPRIRQLAAERGLDPDRWVKIITGESRWNPAARALTSKEDSRGLLQLNVKGGLGAEALKQGVSLAPENWEQQAAFGMDHAVKHGDHAWTVARQLDGRPTPGIPINPVVRGNGSTAPSKGGAPTPAATPRKDGAPGPPDVPVLPNSGVDKGLLAIREFKNEAEAKQQQQAHQTAVDQGQQQMTQLQEQAAQPMAPTAPLAAPPPAPAPNEAADFAALMLPRIRRGLLADPRDYGLLGG